MLGRSRVGRVYTDNGGRGFAFAALSFACGALTGDSGIRRRSLAHTPRSTPETMVTHSATARPSAASDRRERPTFRRVLLKLSGEAMAGGTTASKGLGISPEHLAQTAGELIRAHQETGVQLVVVPGGGNIVRGAELAQHRLLHRAAADQIGMLGTIINAVALQGALEHHGATAEVMSAVPVDPIARRFDRHEADLALKNGLIVITAAGVGQPYFTTDSGAALRAVELDCDAILKATKVDGVYSDDPATNPNASRFDTLPIQEAVERRLRVMDLAALTMCEEHGIDIAVCNFDQPGNLTRFLKGEPIGTLLRSGGTPAD